MNVTGTIRCLSLMVLLALGGCGSEYNSLAPVEYIGGARSPVTTTSGGTTAVAKGETLMAVSRRTGVPLRDLIEANNLSPPFTLHPRQILTLPARRYHLVQKGDTLYSISRTYGVDRSSLVALNNLSPPYTVKLGTRLRIPASIEPTPTRIADAGPVSAALQPSPEGGTITATPLASPMPTEAPHPVVTASPTAVPAEPNPDKQPPPKRNGKIQTVTVISPGAPKPERRPKSALPTRTVTTSAPVAVKPSSSGHRVAVLKPPPARTSRGFAWPVSGDVISTYGAKPGGTYNEGINIQAAEGMTVRAAESGVIAYAGNEIRGYGNLILIRHAGGWMTAYGHNKTLLVKRGEIVRKRQPIARVGHTGAVTVPQLHFEIRKNGDSVNPLKYLTRGKAGS